MPIKWSALQVNQAMDEVEHQLGLAEAFLDEAKAKARETRNILDLPNYLDERLVRLVIQIERLDYVKAAIDSVRKAIPEGAVEAEIKRQKQGIQQSLGF
jgi:division protein CdvB (Snf7/Vps24/ESCRT-III family)